jgi:hypothetical protein
VGCFAGFGAVSEEEVLHPLYSVEMELGEDAGGFKSCF